MTIIAKIANIKSQLSPSAQKIAALILQQPAVVVSLSSLQLAQQANVGQSSIVKFTQKLGFSGFPTFKNAIKEELTRQQAIGNDPQQLQNQISASDTLVTIAQKLAHQKTDAIIETTNAIDEQNLKNIVALFINADRIQLVGFGHSAVVAKDFSAKLLTLGMMAIAEQDCQNQIEIANTLGATDIQCHICYDGNHQHALLAANNAKNKGATIIALTSVHASPLRQLAQFSLDTLAIETSNQTQSQPHNYSLASHAAQQALTDLLFMALTQQPQHLAQ
ncbi:MurR/RpiR family transcriptional regulator [Photobacterium andalusiense]|uniref:HTH-type transcriptional regulator MurR n=1 Tax=Photobacterium andalusiense TaxID=2204296 RepID=A0A1Y6MI94_9GAMM|nr:SIS domain-containing protein [Photobacterium andalusiense]SMY35518.1 HTH-type transcriptional regulator MurR [Photobacterium andalusiense]